MTTLETALIVVCAVIAVAVTVLAVSYTHLASYVQGYPMAFPNKLAASWGPLVGGVCVRTNRNPFISFFKFDPYKRTRRSGSRNKRPRWARKGMRA